MSVLEADEYQSERELLQPKLYNTFNHNKATKENANDNKFKSKKLNPPPKRPGVKYINAEDEDQMEIYGFSPNPFKTFITWTLIILSFGTLWIIFHWKPHWMLFCTHNRCSLEKAKKVLLIDHFMQKFTETVVRVMNDQLFYSQNENLDSTTNGSTFELLKPNGQFEKVNSIVYFDNKKVRYVWDDDLKEFVKVTGLEKNVYCTYFYTQKGLDANRQKQRQKIYGLNEIDVQVQNLFQILFKEVLEPFYIFQVFSLILWFSDSYFYYATCIIITSVASLASSSIQTKKNQKQLRDTVHAFDNVNVCRGNDVFENIESTQLVPGDIIEVPTFGCTMSCDAVLVSGNAIVNESMLTGESVPVTKTPIPNTTLHLLYNSKEHAKHTLFCGTRVIQTRYYNNLKVRAIVIRTGYQTVKGELVRSIMFPKPVDFKLNRHIQNFVTFLSCLAVIGFFYTLVLKTYRGVNWSDILIKSLDLITIVVPPALPAAMTIGTVYAQARLRKSGIYCISPRSINLSGCINCFCFDKTGTLTEDDLSFSEVVPCNKYLKQFDNPIHEPAKNLEYGPLLINLASCHSLTWIEGKLVGDPLDLKMFESTGWVLEEPEVNDSSKYDLLGPSVVRPLEDFQNKEVGIIRQFTFSSSLQRMSVVVRQINGTQFELYCKGSPEMIASLCDSSSLPSDFSSTLQFYTEKGYRVLGLAYRPLTSLNYHKVQRASREDLEKNLTFLGLLVMGNMLKPETTEIIQILTKANIRCVMVTGDNMLTALSVARECSMIQPWHTVKLVEIDTQSPPSENSIPKIIFKSANRSHQAIDPVNLKMNSYEDPNRTHIAITGKTFQIIREHYPTLLKQIAVRGTVFSRMSPEQKQYLIELLQEIGYYVAMCGDGANDCGALKAAHAGISLSDTEASIASPFTSKRANISCGPILIQEGRASIVTSFGVLKYMACCSLTQFISVIILYTFHSNLTDKEFLYIDLFLITVFVFLFGRNEAFSYLAPSPPPLSLSEVTTMASIILQVALVTLWQTLAIILIQQQPWYKKHVPVDENDLQSDDNYALFSITVFQYITLAIVFSKGKPYRKPLYTNYLFLISLIVMTLITIWVVLFPAKFIQDIFEMDLTDVTFDFRFIMLILAFAHFVLANLIESLFVNYVLFKKSKHFLKYFKKNEPEFKVLDKQTRNNNSWMPLEKLDMDIDLKNDGPITDNNNKSIQMKNAKHLMNGMNNDDNTDSFKV